MLLRASVPLDDPAEKQDTSVAGATTVETDSLLTEGKGALCGSLQAAARTDGKAS